MANAAGAVPFVELFRSLPLATRRRLVLGPLGGNLGSLLVGVEHRLLGGGGGVRGCQRLANP